MHKLKRLAQTTAGQLQPGDRFFKTNDPQKKVYEIKSKNKSGKILTVIERGLLFDDRLTQHVLSVTNVTFLTTETDREKAQISRINKFIQNEKTI